MKDIITTINMKSGILDKISRASEEMNISMNRMIQLLIVRMIHNIL